MKKLFFVVGALILTTALFTACLCFSASAEDVIYSGSSGSTSWTLNETTGELIVSSEGGIYSTLWKDYISAVKTVTIQDGVNTIGNSVFSNHPNLTHVSIPASVTLLSDSAFENCGSLMTVTFAEDSILVYIDRYVFSGCTSLTGITLPATVREIGERAFFGCTSLGEVSFGENDRLSSIGELAFYDCDSLISITIPAKVTEIGDAIFSDCNNLKTVLFEENSQLSYLGNQAFSNCESLTSVTVPAGVTQLYTDTFNCCRSLSDLSFEENSRLEYIAERVFYDCDSLTRLTLPASVTQIEEYAFSGNDSLVHLAFEDNSQLTSIGSWAFSSCDSLVSVSFGKNSKLSSIGEYAFSYCPQLTSFTIPARLTEIGKYAFENCKNLKSITFDHNESLSSIDASAFKGCSIEDIYVIGLEEWLSLSFTDYEWLLGINGSLHFPDENGKEITDLILPESITTIPAYAFYNATGLKSISFEPGSSLTFVGRGAFEGCTNLEDVYISDLEVWLSASFEDVYSSHPNSCGTLHLLDENGKEITDLILPESITEIPAFAFYGSNFKSVTIPSTITRIGDSAFCCSLSLESVTILPGVTAIGEYAFGSCENIKDVYITDVASWMSITFGMHGAYPNEYAALHILDENGDEVTDLVLPEGITEIPSYIFCNGTFKSVTFPSSLTKIKYRAFYKCYNLVTVTISSVHN